MTFPLPIDRGVQRYLDTLDFVAFRKTNRTHYYDNEAWRLRAQFLPFVVPGCGPRKKIGLNYLLSWAVKLNSRVASDEWVQSIVNWIEYRSSIKIMYLFLKHYRLDFFQKMDMSRMSSRQRFVWLRLCCRSSRLFKRLRVEDVPDERPKKRMVDTFSMYRNLQQCCC